MSDNPLPKEANRVDLPQFASVQECLAYLKRATLNWPPMGIDWPLVLSKAEQLLSGEPLSSENVSEGPKPGQEPADYLRGSFESELCRQVSPYSRAYIYASTLLEAFTLLDAFCTASLAVGYDLDAIPRPVEKLPLYHCLMCLGWTLVEAVRCLRDVGQADSNAVDGIAGEPVQVGTAFGKNTYEAVHNLAAEICDLSTSATEGRLSVCSLPDHPQGAMEFAWWKLCKVLSGRFPSALAVKRILVALESEARDAATRAHLTEPPESIPSKPSRLPERSMSSLDGLFHRATQEYASSDGSIWLAAIPADLKLDRCDLHDPRCGEVREGRVALPWGCFRNLGNATLWTDGCFQLLAFSLLYRKPDELERFAFFSMEAGAALVAFPPAWARSAGSGDSLATWVTALIFLSPAAGQYVVERDGGLRLMTQPWAASLATLREWHFQNTEAEPDANPLNPGRMQQESEQLPGGPQANHSDGDENDRGQVCLAGSWHRFGSQQKRLLLWVLRNQNGKVQDAIHSLGLTGPSHFDKLLHDLRKSLKNRFKKSDRSPSIHQEGQILSLRWTERRQK
jgi:hypothetical protein